MTDQEFTTIKVTRETAERLRNLGKKNYRSGVKQLEAMLEAWEKLNIQSIEHLPHPEGCIPVPLVTVLKQE